jgi:hypothetical protein
MKQFCYTRGFGYVYDEMCSYFISRENQKFLLLTFLIVRILYKTRAELESGKARVPDDLTTNIV